MSPCCSLVTPVGTLRLVAGDNGLDSLSWSEDESVDPEPSDPQLLLAREELRQYFSGELRNFTVKVDFSRWQGFTAQVYVALRAVLSLRVAPLRCHSESRSAW